jgi:hypothetical protein
MRRTSRSTALRPLALAGGSAMESSFVQLRGRGFWARDTPLQAAMCLLHRELLGFAGREWPVTPAWRLHRNRHGVGSCHHSPPRNALSRIDGRYRQSHEGTDDDGRRVRESEHSGDPTSTSNIVGVTTKLMDDANPTGFSSSPIYFTILIATNMLLPELLVGF